MIRQFYLDRRPHRGMTYAHYFAKMAAKIQDGHLDSLSEKEQRLREYTRLNYQRSLRVQKTYSVSPELRQELQKIEQPQLWMVLTEDWCGDSAQILPQIAAIAAGSNKIAMRILSRDENPDIMEHYLTNGKKGIPKLIAFDESGEELFRWGPRPVEAARIVREGLKKGIPKEEIYPDLHRWYARDRGKSVDREFREILGKLNSEKADRVQKVV